MISAWRSDSVTTAPPIPLPVLASIAWPRMRPLAGGGKDGDCASPNVRVLSVLSTIGLKREVHRRMMQPFLARGLYLGTIAERIVTP